MQVVCPSSLPAATTDAGQRSRQRCAAGLVAVATNPNTARKPHHRCGQQDIRAVDDDAEPQDDDADVREDGGEDGQEMGAPLGGGRLSKVCVFLLTV